MKLFDPGSQDQRYFVLPVLAFLMRDLWAFWYIDGSFPWASRVSILYSCVLSPTVGLIQSILPGHHEAQIC